MLMMMNKIYYVYTGVACCLICMRRTHHPPETHWHGEKVNEYDDTVCNTTDIHTALPEGTYSYNKPNCV